MKLKVLKIWLRFLASKVLNRYNPRIVAITGSTGKTSTKEAVFTVLNDGTDKVGKTWANLNTEFGVTANIIDPKFEGTQVGNDFKLSFKDLFSLTFKAFKLIISKNDYPEILILELAADRPGDIKYFMQFIKPEVGILTNIGDVHLEFFGSKAELVEEKANLIVNTLESGLIILNQDDEFTNLISKKTISPKIFISTKQPADWQASNIGVSNGGIHFNLIHNNQEQYINLPIHGPQFIYAVVTAIAVGNYFNIPIQEAIGRLKNFKLAKGRFERIDLGRIILIDDTYNANPTSTAAALEALDRMGGKQRRKVAILGDMRELGGAHDKGHRKIGQLASKMADLLFVVGEGGRLIGETAIQSGLSSDKVVELDIDRIKDVISKNIQDNDIVLIKGSKAVGMYRVVEVIKQIFKNE